MSHVHLLSAKEAAHLLGCREATLALWRRLRTGPSYVRVGRRLVRYQQQDLARWLEANRVTPRGAVSTVRAEKGTTV